MDQGGQLKFPGHIIHAKFNQAWSSSLTKTGDYVGINSHLGRTSG